jgi:hypothetical protein
MNTLPPTPSNPENLGPQSLPHGSEQGRSPRAFVGGAAAVTGLSLTGGWSAPVAAAASHDHGHGIRQNVVVGGDGPPLQWVHGWPENWYAWRFPMPTLARDFTVIAVAQRGIGLTQWTRNGFNSAKLTIPVLGIGAEQSWGCTGRRGNEARRERGGDRRHPGRRPLARRPSPGEDAGGAHPIPGPLPGCVPSAPPMTLCRRRPDTAARVVAAGGEETW